MTETELIEVNLNQYTSLFLCLEELRQLFYNVSNQIENNIDPIIVSEITISWEDACRISIELEQYVETFDELYPWFYEPELDATQNDFNWKKEGF